MKITDKVGKVKGCQEQKSHKVLIRKYSSFQQKVPMNYSGILYTEKISRIYHQKICSVHTAVIRSNCRTMSSLRVKMKTTLSHPTNQWMIFLKYKHIEKAS